MFAPTDPNVPDSRRKQLLAKLMQQAQQHGAASRGTALSHGAGGLGLGAPSGFFHGLGSQLPVVGPASTQGTNVSASIAPGLGIQGYIPQGSEASPVAGQALGPASARISDLHFSPHDVSGGSAIPSPSVQAPVLPTYTPGGLTNVMSSPFTPNDLAGVNAGGGMIPLGGGHFYDPVGDTVIAPHFAAGI